ncbi:MAG: UDP-N-acetylglucosamine 1-carboxyvinyltransferase, partial [Christensenellaceae bacterium]|nr:UDP-N-acetylglucosamine 1-carboxyvinyltransferase [Christensenellaceae bacterium]
CTIENVPDIEDVSSLVEILRYLGAQVNVLPENKLYIDATNISKTNVPLDLTLKLRASYYFLGALIGKYKEAEVASPGGCELGGRPMDQHFKGFTSLGVEFDKKGHTIKAKCKNLIGNSVFFDVVSVGATINVLLAAVKAKGVTVLYKAAKEPHIVDLANFLNSMGAKIRGAGTDVIRITGVEKLHGSTYMVIQDQIETGTMMIAAAATHGDVLIHDCIPTHMESLTAKLLELGVRVASSDDRIRVSPISKHRNINVTTQVYPGFPTDLQQPMTSLLTMVSGINTITETIFEQRFNHVNELLRMGADIQIKDKTMTIIGVNQLYGAPVNASDLRAGAALIIAGLMAKGVTEISGTHFIDRGYDHIEKKLKALGANIKRVQLHNKEM